MPAVFPEMSDGSGPIIENIDYVLDSGLFSLVETTYRKSEEDFIKLKNYLAQKQVRIIYLAPSAIYQQKLDLNSLDETERKKAASFLRDFISRAYFLNAEMLLICCGPDPGPEYRKQAKRQLVKSLCELLQFTRTFQKDYLLDLIFENFDRDLQMRRLLGPTRESVDLIMEVKKNFGNINLILDQSHLRQLGEDHQESLFLARNCLGHVHLANCLLKDRSHPQWGDSHLAFNTEGSELGTSDIVQMLHTLFQIGYLKEGGGDKLPTISLEVKPSPPNSDPYATFKDTCNTFLEAWGRFKSRVSFED